MRYAHLRPSQLHEDVAGLNKTTVVFEEMPADSRLPTYLEAG